MSIALSEVCDVETENNDKNDVMGARVFDPRFNMVLESFDVKVAFLIHMDKWRSIII